VKFDLSSDLSSNLACPVQQFCCWLNIKVSSVTSLPFHCISFN